MFIDLSCLIDPAFLPIPRVYLSRVFIDPACFYRSRVFIDPACLIDPVCLPIPRVIDPACLSISRVYRSRVVIDPTCLSIPRVYRSRVFIDLAYLIRLPSPGLYIRTLAYRTKCLTLLAKRDNRPKASNNVGYTGSNNQKLTILTLLTLSALLTDFGHY